MTVYEIKFADGSTCHMPGSDPEHASSRAADLYRKDVVAWRYDRRPQIRVGAPGLGSD